MKLAWMTVCLTALLAGAGCQDPQADRVGPMPTPPWKPKIDVAKSAGEQPYYLERKGIRTKTNDAKSSSSLVGEWIGDPVLPNQAEPRVNQLLESQLGLIKQYGPLELKILDGDRYEMTYFGYKYTGTTIKRDTFIELDPETLQGTKVSELKGKTVKGPDGKDSSITFDQIQPINLEIIDDNKRLRFDQGPGSTMLVFHRKKI